MVSGLVSSGADALTSRGEFPCGSSYRAATRPAPGAGEGQAFLPPAATTTDKENNLFPGYADEEVSARLPGLPTGSDQAERAGWRKGGSHLRCNARCNSGRTCVDNRAAPARSNPQRAGGTEKSWPRGQASRAARASPAAFAAYVTAAPRTSPG